MFMCARVQGHVTWGQGHVTTCAHHVLSMCVNSLGHKGQGPRGPGHMNICSYVHVCNS